AYWYKGYACGYGAFYSMIGLMAEKYGAPYNTFPFTMLEANKGGISDWGTICGALYGSAAAFALFYGRKERNAMVNELFRWYEVTKLPIYQPGDKAQGVAGELPSNVAGSVMCHISVSKWCYANKIEATSKQRSERCGRLTADVAAKAVEILNAKIDAGKDYKGVFAKQEAVSACGECHQTKGEEANWAKGVLDCTPCHNGGSALSNKFEGHP
ncbi:MAG: C-GCAxxG-C-C family protein, partial [Desulfovibrionaceae bacterium]|nr:C-GCAxxG-C-C family protein [Desulfovibrionaceae bacterium]